MKDIKIKKHNEQPHLDMEQDLQKKKNGLFTFILRVADGNIVDYVVMAYESYEELNLSPLD